MKSLPPYYGILFFTTAPCGDALRTASELTVIVPDSTTATTTLQPSSPFLRQIYSTVMNVSFDPAYFIPATQSKIKVPPASQRMLEFGTYPLTI
jgi:hypothetical protein